MKKLVSLVGLAALLSAPAFGQAVGGGSTTQSVTLTLSAGAFQITNISAGTPALALNAGTSGTNQPAALSGGTIAFQVQNTGVALNSWTVAVRLDTGALPGAATAFPLLRYVPGTGTVAQTAGSGYTGGATDSGTVVASGTTASNTGIPRNTVVRTAAANGGATGISGTFAYTLGSNWNATYTSANSPAGAYPYTVQATLTGVP